MAGNLLNYKDVVKSLTKNHMGVFANLVKLKKMFFCLFFHTNKSDMAFFLPASESVIIFLSFY